MHHSVPFSVMLSASNGFIVNILLCSSNVAYLESPKKKNASNNLPDLVSNDHILRVCCLLESFVHILFNPLHYLTVFS